MEIYGQQKQIKNFLENNTNPKRNMAKLITITSGKGGVGKSNFILNLSIALSIKGKRVLLIDADMNLSNIDVLLGVYPEYAFADLVNGNAKLEELLITGPKGIKILPAASGDLEVLHNTEYYQKELIQAYQELRSDFDYILIDTGAGISGHTVDFVVNSDRVVVISTPEPTSITDAYAMIKILFHRMKNPDIYLVVNMAKTVEEGESVFKKVSLIVQHFLNKSIRSLGHVLYDTLLPQAVREQSPLMVLHPRSKASLSVREIANRLLQEDSS